jgi:hypothetical protein
MNCQYCEGKGWIPHMYSSNRVYYIRYHGCGPCNMTGKENYRNRCQKGCPGHKMVGYIPKGQQVPSLSEILEKK